MGGTRAVPGGCIDIPTESRRILSEVTDASRQATSIGSPAAWSVAGTMWTQALQDLPVEGPCHHFGCTPLLPILSWETPRHARMEAAMRKPRGTWWLRSEDLWHPWRREDP